MVALTTPPFKPDSSISYGTHFSDGARVGPIFTGSVSSEVTYPSAVPYYKFGYGVLLSPQNTYNFSPYPSGSGNIAAANSYTSSQYLTLLESVGAPNAAVTTVLTPQNQTYCQFDWPRCVSITVAGTALTNLTPVTIFGFDWYGIPMQHTITVQATGTYGVGFPTTAPNAFNVANKAFYGVTDVYVNVGAGAVSAGTISVQTTNVFGLPYACQSWDHVMNWRWAGTGMMDQSGQDQLVVGGGASAVTVDTPAVSVAAAGPPIVLNLPLMYSDNGTATAANVGSLYMSAAVDRTSFSITSTNNGDVSKVSWVMPQGGKNLMQFASSATPTATTGDVRGLIKLPETGDTWAYVPDGLTSCLFTQYVFGADNWINQLAAGGHPIGAQLPGPPPVNPTYSPLNLSDLVGLPQYYTGVPV